MEARWVVRWTRDQAVRVHFLVRDTVFCPWARHLTLTVPLSTKAYKWVPGGEFNAWGNPAMD